MRIDLRFDEGEFHFEILLGEFFFVFNFRIPGDKTAHNQGDDAVHGGNQSQTYRQHRKFAGIGENRLVESNKTSASNFPAAAEIRQQGPK